MIRETANALVACVVTFVLCAVAYPAAVWGLGQLTFPRQAEGSLIYGRDGSVIGSELIAQPFTSERYFFPRPSAVDYKADATGGSNLGTKNPDLRKKVVERAEALKATEREPVPVDLVTASGGGMDPHISPEAAAYQAARVAAARKMPLDQVRALIDRHMESSGAVIGAPRRVNVLRLNLALDEEKPAPATPAAAEAGKTAGTPEPTPADTTGPAATGPAAPGPGAAEELGAIGARVGELADRIELMGKQLDAVSQNHSAGDQTRAGMKALDERLSKLAEDVHPIPELVKHVDGLDGRLNAADQSVRQIQAGVREARDSLKALARPAPAAMVPAARAATGPS